MEQLTKTPELIGRTIKNVTTIYSDGVIIIEFNDESFSIIESSVDNEGVTESFITSEKLSLYQSKLAGFISESEYLSELESDRHAREKEKEALERRELERLKLKYEKEAS